MNWDGVDLIECVVDVIITVLVNSPVTTAYNYVEDDVAAAVGTYDSMPLSST